MSALAGIGPPQPDPDGTEGTATVTLTLKLDDFQEIRVTRHGCIVSTRYNEVFKNFLNTKTQNIEFFIYTCSFGLPENWTLRVVEYEIKVHRFTKPTKDKVFTIAKGAAVIKDCHIFLPIDINTNFRRNKDFCDFLTKYSYQKISYNQQINCDRKYQALLIDNNLAKFIKISLTSTQNKLVLRDELFDKLVDGPLILCNNDKGLEHRIVLGWYAKDPKTNKITLHRFQTEELQEEKEIWRASNSLSDEDQRGASSGQRPLGQAVALGQKPKDKSSEASESPALDLSQTQVSELYSQKLKTSTKQRTEIQPKGRVGSQSLFENVKTDQIFTTLTIHEGPKHLKQNETQLLHTETRKEIKKCADLFAAVNRGKDHPRSILIDGRAGIGKTLFTQKLVRDWAKDCLFDKQDQSSTYRDIKFAFLINFRQLNLLGEKEVSLVELLNLSSTLNETTTLDDQMMEYIIEHQDQLLLVMDGYDEYKDRGKITSDFQSAFPENAKEKMPVAALVSKLVRKLILTNSVTMVTSRSSQAGEIAETIHFDRYVEISGFSKPHFNEYVNKYFELKPDEIRNKAANKVNGSQQYMSFGVVPLLCYLMCVVIEWEIANSLTSDNLDVQTLTEFYSLVVNCVERNYNRAISSLSKTAASEAVTKTLDNFSRLSAKLLERNRFSFTEEDLTNLTITEEELEYIKSSSLLSCTPVASNSPFGETTYEYSFHHYTFQEFLACRYFVSTNQMPSELTDISCVFMSGLMDPRKNARLMEELLQSVGGQLGGTMGPILLLKCLEEYKDKEFVTRVLIESDLRYEYWGDDDLIDLEDLTDMDCSCVAMLVKTLTAASHRLLSTSITLHIRSSSLTSSGLQVIMSALTIKNCIIAKLYLFHCKLDEQCGKMIGLFLEHTNITQLELPSNSIGDIGAACIAEHSSNLTVLNLGANGITEIGLNCIAKNCRMLTELRLGESHVTDRDVDYIAEHCNNLTGLFLNMNSITDSGAVFIAKRCGNLTKLHLSWNKITDSGALCIAKNCGKLTSLKLSINSITDTGVDYIVKHCGNLTRLFLDMNPVSDECKERTRQFCTENYPGLDLSI